jgi:hypothetical protein
MEFELDRVISLEQIGSNRKEIRYLEKEAGIRYI